MINKLNKTKRTSSMIKTQKKKFKILFNQSLVAQLKLTKLLFQFLKEKRKHSSIQEYSSTLAT